MLLMPACPRAALGDTARDITTQCKITSSDSDSSIKSLYDRDETTGCGVRAIWNFAPIDLNVGRDVAINNVHLSDSLMVLTYSMRHTRGSGK